MATMKVDGTGNIKRKHCVVLYGEMAMKLS